MKWIAIAVILILAVTAGLFAWRATLPVETWTFRVMSPRELLDSGDLVPRGDPLARRNLLRTKVLKALPATLPPAEEEWRETSILTLRVECSIYRRHWRWEWPPLDRDFPIQQSQQVHLYHRSGPSGGWQAYYSSARGQQAVSRDQAIERLIDLIEDHIQTWIPTANKVLTGD